MTPVQAGGRLCAYLEKDEGLSRLLWSEKTHGLRRRALERRWRGERNRSVPSASAVIRYLSEFHDPEEEIRRQPHTAFIPADNDALRGLKKVNVDMVRFVQRHAGQAQATLDMDATLIETHKKEAKFCYNKYRAYQPLTTYWSEADLIVHSEFRDGNVPAGHQQRRALEESLECLPDGVDRALMRSDTAGYQQELLRYCAEGRCERFGVIEFAVGVDVTESFRTAVREVEEYEWQVLRRRVGDYLVDAGQEYAEVCFVPNWIGHRNSGTEYRFIAIREPLRKPSLPGMESQSEVVSDRVVETGYTGWYKVSGVVTNVTVP